MKNSIKIDMVIIIFTLLVISFKVVQAQTTQIGIEHITIISCDFKTHYTFPLTAERLLKMCISNNQYASCSVVPVRNEILIKLMNQKINVLTDKDTLSQEQSGLDTRVVCLLRRRSGAQIDTLSFGNNTGLNPPAMQINDKYYRLDKELLRSIADYVPEIHHSGIIRYIDIVVPRYEEMLDKYYHEHPDEPDRR